MFTRADEEGKMAIKKVTYKEPSDYFTPGMLKAAEEWEKEKKAKKQKAEKQEKKKK